MNFKHFKYFLFFLLLFAVPVALAAGNGEKNKRLSKTTGEPAYTHFNINQISTWIKNDGESDISSASSSGFVYPKGSNKTAIYQSGFLWGAKVAIDDTTDQIRVGGSVYRQGLVPGKLLNSGVPWQNLQAEDPGAANVRIYRVRPDWADGNVQSEINDGEGSESEIRAAYEADWNAWPATDGAPYEDTDSNGIYDPAIDVPGVPGADQTIWFVANDADDDQTKFMYGSLPLGIEMQATIWGYNQAGPLGNMMFRKYKIINKSDIPFKDMYVSMWNDPDLGGATDDFVGCDTTLSMTFVYNATSTDDVYGSQPAAAGFDFFQGPIVAGEATDSAYFNNQIVYGKKNLPMTAHYFFINGDAIYTDPDQGEYATGTLQWYNLLQGKVGSTGEVFPVPEAAGGGNTVFALSGDPITQTGWVDGIQHSPGDRRAGMASGPFTMAPGDTQEIVVAEIAAIGSDNLGSVTLLKNYDLKAQEAFEAFFILPSAPKVPQVTAKALDEAVLLNWGGDADRYVETESNNEEGFTFEGYNVYQLSDNVGTEKIKIATYDLNNGVKTIVGKDIDVTTGAEIQVVQQAGNDVGIQHYINITKDYVNNTTLVNGRRYYFAVTSYSYNPDPNAVPNNLENPISVITVTPESTDPGERYASTTGDTVTVVKTAGVADGSVVAIVVDPSAVTGHQYEVRFHSEGSDVLWNVVDVTTGETKVTNQTNQTGDGSYPVVDGLLIKVMGPPPGMKDWDIPAGDRRWTWANAAGWGMEGFEGAMGNALDTWVGVSTVTHDQLKNVLIKFAQTDESGNIVDPNDANASLGYRYLRRANQAAADPDFAPYIVHPDAGYAFQDFTKHMPFAAYDNETNPPTRLAVGWLENNVADGLVDGKYWPNSNDAGIENTDAAGPREFFFIFQTPYSETEDPTLAVDALNTELPMMWLGTPNRRGTNIFNAGDEFLILANHINLPADVYQVQTADYAATTSSELAAADVEKINVFPNPYYGVNPEEINKYQRFVTLNHLPTKATIRIFNLAGQLVRTIAKDDVGQFQRWDLQTEDGLPVASGLYIIYVDMPDLGKTKILKAAIIQEQQILDRY